MPIPIDHIECHYTWLVTGSTHTSETTMAFSLDGTEDPADVAADLLSVFVTTYTSSANSEITFTGGYALVGNDGPDIRFDVPLSTGGSGGAGAMAMNGCWLISKRTGFAGRRYRGRMYLWGPGESIVSPAGIITSGSVTSFQTTTNTFLSVSNATPGVDRAVLLHEGLGAPDPTPLLTTGGVVVRSKIATQRRRLLT